MSLTVEKLNDDTTFLLAFAPTFAPKKSPGRRFPGAFTILIDPWLRGQSSILHPKFQRSNHTTQCAIGSLAELDDLPDLIIVSQDKPDHCHRATLCSLPHDARTRILAVPGAAKKIKSWKHFNEDVIHVLRPYDPEKPGVLTEIRLAPYTSSSSAGKITIANIATKRDVTGLHNAVGITYRPPGSLLTAFDRMSVRLSDMIRPETPSKNGKLHKARSQAAIKVSQAMHSPPATPSRPRATSSPRPTFLDPLGRSQSTTDIPPLPTDAPPLPSSDSPQLERIDSKVNTATRHHKESTISLVYTPHGLAFSTLKPYVDRHLSRIGALPLTALFHCVNTEENPWFMGGTVARGAPGGVELASRLSVKYWISAHDEHKENKGLATVWIKSREYGAQEVMRMLEDAVGDGRAVADVRMLGVAERLRIDV